jgi:hypothetical protein
MDAWYYRISLACNIIEEHKGDVRTIWVHSPITYASVAHSTRPSRAMWQTHAPNIQQEAEEEKEDTPHVDTWRNVKVWVDFFSGLHQWQIPWYKKKKYDNKEWDLNTTSIRSLGFCDIKECVTLWRSILWSFGCVYCMEVISVTDIMATMMKGGGRRYTYSTAIAQSHS